MLRISAGVSLCFTLLAVGGGLAACSSDSTGGGNGGSSSGGTSSTAGSGGKGTVITGGSDSDGGTGGGRAGSTGTGGGGTGATDCANAPVVCVDAQTASTCDPDTMMDVTIKCTEDAAEIGLISNGCKSDPIDGDGCTIDDFADQECADGVPAVAACENLTDDQLINVYVNCYTDFQGAHDIVTCYGSHVTGTQVDCAAAEADCFGAGAGGDGAGGAGAGRSPG